MSSTPTGARVDGLPAAPVRQQAQLQAGAANDGSRHSRAVSARQRARIERQTAVVHDARTDGPVKRWLALQAAETERQAIRQDLARAGLL